MRLQQSCPICSGVSRPLDVVDFNKSCAEAAGQHLPLSGVPVYYFLCETCGFCFAPEICLWSRAEFEQKIYNSEYVLVDPDYLGKRPRTNAQAIIKMFGERKSTIRHLDYGGGNGLLSSLLHDAGWQSVSYDPFYNKEQQVANLGKFNLITALEVFEHVPDVSALMSDLRELLADDGIILFSTLLSDSNIVPGQRITWWYASPRNGHISLFSRQSLAMLGKRDGFELVSFSAGFHAFFISVPLWASHIIRSVI